MNNIHRKSLKISEFSKLYVFILSRSKKKNKFLLSSSNLKFNRIFIIRECERCYYMHKNNKMITKIRFNVQTKECYTFTV